MKRLVRAAALCAGLALTSDVHAILDLNANLESDIWETNFNVGSLPPLADTDGDGFSNVTEALAGTDPRNLYSRPALNFSLGGGVAVSTWNSLPGKRYQVQASTTLDAPSWRIVSDQHGTGYPLGVSVPLSTNARFFRLVTTDYDADGDGLSDWEEIILGTDANNAHTGRNEPTDGARVQAAWPAESLVTVAVLDGEISERWPDAGVVAIRRGGGLKRIVVNFALGGTATTGVDYVASATTGIEIPAGEREVWVKFQPLADSADREGTETITLTAAAGAGYTLAAPSAATINLADETATSAPKAKAAARFLVQAAFGPDQDSAADADLIPENVEEVTALGFSAWIDAQFARPATFLQPFTEAAATIPEFAVDPKSAAWWNRAMGAAKSRPGGPAVAYDPLRQRVAFCLSQIFVVSDRPETLWAQPVGMANYYDVLVAGAFGNYRDLLYNVTRHPVMGFFLSALKNQKPDPVNNIFPDENYAREVMQLFSIGLWELNADGTRRKDVRGNDIPTYDNVAITNFARVFTGMSFADGASFINAAENWAAPMKMWDAYHDLGAKTLLRGLTLPARPASAPDIGTAGLADLDAAIDNIFNHPNVGPFVARQLIQRLVTSNPTPAYIGRVAAAFANNGSGVRGDMKAVIRAILLDDEARNPAHMSEPTFGKMREPFLRVVNVARAFDASAPWGFYQLDAFTLDHYEEPMKAASVFNFFLPGYTPPGEIQAAGLVAPEFQILNATSAISAPNYYQRAILGGLHRGGTADPDRNVKLNLAPELALVADTNVDTLIRRLDLSLTCGQLTPSQFRTIRDAVLRVGPDIFDWQNERVRLAIYLIVTSPEFCILR